MKGHEFTARIHELDDLIRLYEQRHQDTKMKLRALRKERMKLLTMRARLIAELPAPLSE